MPVSGGKSARQRPVSPVPAHTSSASSISSSGIGGAEDLNSSELSLSYMPRQKRRERRLKMASNKGYLSAASYPLLRSELPFLVMIIFPPGISLIFSCSVVHNVLRCILPSPGRTRGLIPTGVCNDFYRMLCC